MKGIPEIINVSSFESPLVLYFVRRSIKIIGPRRFGNISKIVLRDTIVEDPKDVGSVGHNLRSPISKGYRVFGYYYFASDNRRAYIELYLREIYRGIPFPFSSTPLMVLRFTRYLAHEIAHHAIHEKKRCLDDVKEELVAKRYSDIVIFRLEQYIWFRFWRKILHELSEWHFALATADFRNEDLEKAKDHFYTSWVLNQSNNLAAENFWHVGAILDQSEE